MNNVLLELSTHDKPNYLALSSRWSGDTRPQVIIVAKKSNNWARLGARLHRSGLRLKILDHIPEALLLGNPEFPVCLIIDIGDDSNCISFQQRLVKANIFIPIIFVAEVTDISTSVTAMKNGAIDFFAEPYRDEDLLDSIDTGLARHQAWRLEYQSLVALKRRFDTLSPREVQVMEHVVKGRLNKQVAGDLGISEITVKAHRGHVMRKMKASSLPDLARMADKILQNYPSYDDPQLEAQIRPKADISQKRSRMDRPGHRLKVRLNLILREFLRRLGILF
ncbi:FixJ family two-component response regulator [Phyllobacterium sp. 1468]|uniref:response regulator transcription factor n=1 Tax=Phyllobacterium sp. 1468 TaxID=2817759 RepID=UPI00285EE7E6|nr:LuxR C-terminal-related transcriptional regulator [Phyllobacterium sp. 1468]MDR6635109.1 FixJ family two-component response regulator [Phyllobacterium sp. 1468]